jgi:hypothetical protein
VAGLSSQERPTEPPDGDLPLEVRRAVRLMRRRRGQRARKCTPSQAQPTSTPTRPERVRMTRRSKAPKEGDG